MLPLYPNDILIFEIAPDLTSTNAEFLMTTHLTQKLRILIALAIIASLLPGFTIVAMNQSVAAASMSALDILENKLGVDFTINIPTGNPFRESADKLFDGATLDPCCNSIHPTKYFASEEDFDVTFDFAIPGSRYENTGARISGVQLSTANDEPARDPTGWTLQAWNTTDTVTVSSQTNLLPPTDRDSDYEPSMFEPTGAFRYFRFVVTAIRGTNTAGQLSSLRFIEAPTVIRTQAELMAIGTDLTTLDGNYILGNDIELDDIEPNSGYYIGDGNGLGVFTGSFNGSNFTISNLKSMLFLSVGDGATPTMVSHLKLVAAEGGLPTGVTAILTDQISEFSTIDNVHVAGRLRQAQSSPIGGIVARGSLNSTIQNSSAEVTIELADSFDDIGGLIGSTLGNVTNSFAKVVILGSAVGRIGGLVGTAEFGATITNSASSGTINVGGQNQGTNIGGLLGFSQGAVIANSASSVSVFTTQDSTVGGLIGWAEAGSADEPTYVSNSFASGNVTNFGNSAGGLIGYIDKGNVSHCIATGAVSGFWHIGGLIGLSQSTHIQMSLARGRVVGAKYVGGLIGKFATNIPANLESSTATGVVTSLYSSNSLQALDSSGEGTPGSFGGLVGYVEDQALLRNLSATGNVVVGFHEDFIANEIGGLIGTALADVSQATASGDVIAIGADSVGGLIGYAERKLFHTTSSGTVSGATYVGQLVGRCDDFWCINNSNSSGFSTATLIITADILEGNGDKTSDNSDGSGEGPTESVGPTLFGVALLNGDQNPIAWGEDINVNSGIPFLLALVDSNFYNSQNSIPISGSSVISGARAVKSPSYFLLLLRPTIEINKSHVVCNLGEYAFIREGTRREIPVFSVTEFTLNLNGLKVTNVLKLETATNLSLDLVKNVGTYSCSVKIMQDGITQEFSSLNSSRLKELIKIKKETSHAAFQDFLHERKRASLLLLGMTKSDLSEYKDVRARATKKYMAELDGAAAKVVTTLAKEGISLEVS